MSETLYVMTAYRDARGRDHVRGDKVTVDPGEPPVAELIYRGILSKTAPRRQAGESTAQAEARKK